MLMHLLTAWVHFKVLPFDCPWRHLCLHLTKKIKNDRKCLFWVYLCKSACSKDVIAALHYSTEFMRQEWLDTELREPSSLENPLLNCSHSKMQFPGHWGLTFRTLENFVKNQSSDTDLYHNLPGNYSGFQCLVANSQVQCTGMLLKCTDAMMMYLESKNSHGFIQGHK